MDIVWKIIAGVAALFLAVAAYFSWVNRDALIKEIELRDRATANLTATNQGVAEADESLSQNTDGLATTTEARDAAKKETSEVEASTAEAEAEAASYKAQSDTVGARIADIKDQLKDFAGIDDLLATVKQIEEDIGTFDGDIASQTQSLDLTLANIAAVKTEIGGFRNLERNQALSIMEEDFSGSVSSVFPTWGFVVLNKGNSDGVLHNAELQIDRGEGAIGKLKVTLVEPKRSVASIIDDTWAENELPQPGDQVTRAALKTTSVVKGEGDAQAVLPGGPGVPTGPANGLFPPAPGAPAAPAAPAAAPDPFGGAPAAPADPMAPAAPAAPTGDPFGAPAPAPTADPFGGSAPDAAPTADPFGAPAPEGAPEPTADPFG